VYEKGPDTRIAHYRLWWAGEIKWDRRSPGPARQKRNFPELGVTHSGETGVKRGKRGKEGIQNEILKPSLGGQNLLEGKA